MLSKEDAEDLFYINAWTFQMLYVCVHIYQSALQIHDALVLKQIDPAILSGVENDLTEIIQANEEFVILNQEYRALKIDEWLKKRNLYTPTPVFYGGGIAHFLWATTNAFVSEMQSALEIAKHYKSLPLNKAFNLHRLKQMDTAPEPKLLKMVLANEQLFSRWPIFQHRLKAMDIPLWALYCNRIPYSEIAARWLEEISEKVRAQDLDGGQLSNCYTSKFLRREAEHRLAKVREELMDIAAYDSFKTTITEVKVRLPNSEDFLGLEEIQNRGWPEYLQHYFMLWPFRTFQQTSFRRN